MVLSKVGESSLSFPPNILYPFNFLPEYPVFQKPRIGHHERHVRCELVIMYHWSANMCLSLIGCYMTMNFACIEVTSCQEDYKMPWVWYFISSDTDIFNIVKPLLSIHPPLSYYSVNIALFYIIQQLIVNILFV